MKPYEKVLAILLGIFVLLPALSVILNLLGVCTSDFETLAQDLYVHPSIAFLGCLSKFAMITGFSARLTLFTIAKIHRVMLLALLFAFQIISNTEFLGYIGLMICISVDYTLFKFLTVYSRILPQPLIGALLVASVVFLLSQLMANPEAGNKEENRNSNETDMTNVNECTDESDTDTSDDTSFESSDSDDDHAPGPERQHHEFVNPLYVDDDEELREYIDRIVYKGEPWQYNPNGDYF